MNISNIESLKLYEDYNGYKDERRKNEIPENVISSVKIYKVTDRIYVEKTGSL